MYVIIERAPNGAFVGVVGIFDADKIDAEQFAAERCKNDYERSIKRFIAVQAGAPAGLEMAPGYEFADGRPRLVPVL